MSESPDLCVRALSRDTNTLLYYSEDADVHRLLLSLLRHWDQYIGKQEVNMDLTLMGLMVWKGSSNHSVCQPTDRKTTRERAHPLRCFIHTEKDTHTQTSSAVPADNCMSNTVSNRLHPSSLFHSIIWSSPSIMPFYLLPTSSTHHSQPRAASTKHMNESFFDIRTQNKLNSQLGLNHQVGLNYFNHVIFTILLHLIIQWTSLT